MFFFERVNLSIIIQEHSATHDDSVVWFMPLSLLSLKSQSQSYITTDGRSVSMSWCLAQSGTIDQSLLTP
jgi:hypothetical protein